MPSALYLGDRRGPDIDEVDVGSVERLEVASVEARALGGVRERPRRQAFGNLGVGDDLADLLAEELARQLVRLRIDEDVVELGHDTEQRPLVPTLAKTASALDGVGRQGALLADVDHDADVRRPGLLAVVLVARLAGRNSVRVEGTVVRRRGVRRGPLEHGQPGGLLGNDRDRLDPGRAGADDGDPLAADVDGLMWPNGRVVGRSAERVDAVDLWQLRRRQAAGRHQQELRRHLVAVVGRHDPVTRPFLEHRRVDARLETDVAAEVEAIGDMVGVAKDLRLRRVALRPVPLLFQLWRERVRVVERLDVAARPGIAVPPPRPADVAGGLEDADGKSQTAKSVQGVHPAEPGADDDRVIPVHGTSLALARSIPPECLPQPECYRPGFPAPNTLDGRKHSGGSG